MGTNLLEMYLKIIQYLTSAHFLPGVINSLWQMSEGIWNPLIKICHLQKLPELFEEFGSILRSSYKICQRVSIYLEASVFRIRIRSDPLLLAFRPDPLIFSTDPDPAFSSKYNVTNYKL